jgi:hypothetical protein
LACRVFNRKAEPPLLPIASFLKPPSTGKGQSHHLGCRTNRFLSYSLRKHTWDKETQRRTHCCCSQKPRALAIWDAGEQLILCGGAIGDVNQMFMQPFVNYNLRHGWYLTSSPVVTADWEKQRAERWVVPVGGGVGKIMRVGALPVNMYTQFFSNVEHPQGTSPWSARLQIQLLFPKKQ